MLLAIIKSILRIKARGILNGRYFDGVEFVNKANIKVSNHSYIENGSRLLVTQPVNKEANIIIEEKCWIGRDVEIQTNYGSKIILEKNVSIQDRCKILGTVNIGRDTLLAPDVFLSSGNHHYNYQPELPIKQQDALLIDSADKFSVHNKPVIIEEDCWLGKGSVIASGVVVSRGAIIGANSFVKSNIPPYEIWAGSPAKFIKKRLEFTPPSQINSDKIAERPYFYKGFDHSGTGENGLPCWGTAICILERSERNSLILSGEIHEEGLMAVWAGEELIADVPIARGILKKELSLNQHQPLQNKVTNHLYRDLTCELKRFLCVIIEFKTNNTQTVPSFSITKIETA
ncbi:acyltransferase [Mucilaginibacter sp. AW1-3]